MLSGQGEISSEDMHTVNRVFQQVHFPNTQYFDQYADSVKLLRQGQVAYEFMPFPHVSVSLTNIGDDTDIDVACKHNQTKDAMQIRDKTIGLLLWEHTSTGNLRAVTILIYQKGPSQIPGTCCLDTVSTSEYFWIMRVGEKG